MFRAQSLFSVSSLVKCLFSLAPCEFLGDLFGPDFGFFPALVSRSALHIPCDGRVESLEPLLGISFTFEPHLLRHCLTSAYIRILPPFERGKQSQSRVDVFHLLEQELSIVLSDKGGRDLDIVRCTLISSHQNVVDLVGFVISDD